MTHTLGSLKRTYIEDAQTVIHIEHPRIHYLKYTYIEYPRIHYLKYTYIEYPRIH